LFGELEYSFECAWSPALPVILKMSEMFPKLKFDLSYEEEGRGFKGKFVCKNNKVSRYWSH